MYINHNQMASNVANTLTSHYGNLATSTQRLSSGLRVNSAADDAAGLAIRELMRADISALNQGVRNANDAISLIQTADGALGIIDEKLIRMKELAEQAATGTYDSTQRLMIESEYQAMASEITRIANATDFNGMKLLNGDLSSDVHDGSDMTATGKMKIHFGSGNNSAEDYYYIQIGDMTAQALGVGNASTWDDVQERAVSALKSSLDQQIRDSGLTDKEKGELLSQIDTVAKQVNDAIDYATNPANAHRLWNGDDPADAFLEGGKTTPSPLMEKYLQVAGQDASKIVAGDIDKLVDDMVAGLKAQDPPAVEAAYVAAIDGLKTKVWEAAKAAGYDKDDTTVKDGLDAINTVDAPYTAPANLQDATIGAWVAQLKSDLKGAIPGSTDAATTAANNNRINDYFNGLRTSEQQKLTYAWGQAAMHNLANGTGPTYKMAKANIEFGADLDDPKSQEAASTMLSNALSAAQTHVKDMDAAGFSIETQEDAQNALDAINDAIVAKDKTRAHLGALQNRLENTVSNLTTQAENLQAAESRISDVDVATEMTNFVRNQILTQSAVAMLSQANSMPQMAMQLIG